MNNMPQIANNVSPLRVGGSLVIGLTGTYCAGKNHIAALLEKQGLPVLDVDKLGHQVIEEKKAAIVERFGAPVLDRDGRVNRRLLGEKVFGKPEKLAALQEIVHPGVNRLTDEWIAAREGKACVINAALLHQSSVFAALSGIIIVKAPFLTRLLRARQRDRLPWRDLLRRFESQKQFTPQYFTKKADIYIVYNRGYTAFGSWFFRKSLENRIDKILFRMGILEGTADYGL